MGYIKMPLLIFPGTFICLRGGGTTGKSLVDYLMGDGESTENILTPQGTRKFPTRITVAFYETRVNFTSGWTKDG